MSNLIDWSSVSKVWPAFEMMGISPVNMDAILPYLKSPICIVGAGLGLNVTYLRNKGFTVSGYDNNRDMIEQAKSLRSVDIQYADATNMPDEDGSFNTVILATGIYNKMTIYEPFSEQVLIEARRVLKKGGNLVIGYFIESHSLNYVFDHLKLNTVPSNSKYFVGCSDVQSVIERFKKETDISHDVLDYISGDHAEIMEMQLNVVGDVVKQLDVSEDPESFVSDSLGFEYYDLTENDQAYFLEKVDKHFDVKERSTLQPGDVSLVVGK